MIRRALHRPDLSAKLVADAFAISERQIHLLFEPTGCSFARTVMAMRLAKARGLLASMPDKPIVDVAYSCGFDSIATFYRAFGPACGMAPGEFRLRHGYA
jgi:transcriptional regulator GlxA family with amidase domain